jgi:Fungal specific transcription factor domain
MFNFVYRPTFTRTFQDFQEIARDKVVMLTGRILGDMETLGPYYSHTLLNAILSQSVRWCRNDPQIKHLLEPYDNGEFFFRQATETLPVELQSGHGKIPTVQTLLLISARECSYGNRTQAWLYSGMAFRLIEDMGICIDGQRYAESVHFSEEEIEIRNRLFWSCYLWDKLISLYLGRSPSLQNTRVSPPQILSKQTTLLG